MRVHRQEGAEQTLDDEGQVGGRFGVVRVHHHGPGRRVLGMLFQEVGDRHQDTTHIVVPEAFAGHPEIGVRQLRGSLSWQLIDGPADAHGIQQRLRRGAESGVPGLALVPDVVGHVPDLRERVEEAHVGFRIGLDETFDVGQDTGSAVVDSYQVPFKFTGNLEQVKLDLL